MSVSLNRKKRIKESALSVLISFAVYFLTLTAAVAVVFSTEDPDSVCESASYTALFASALLSGIAASKISGRNLLIVLTTGILMTLSLGLISIVFFERKLDAASSLLMHAAIPAVTVLGGLISGRRRKRVRRINRKRISSKR